MQQLLKLVRNTCSDAQRELRLIFDNNTLTKQEINDTINDWVRRQSEILVVGYTIDIYISSCKINQIDPVIDYNLHYFGPSQVPYFDFRI